MKIKIKPTWFLANYQAITIDFLQQHQITTIFADIDNTLVDWDNPLGDEALQQWVQRLKQANIQIILVSNNNEMRIKQVAQELALPYVYPGLKPLHRGFRKALELSGQTKDTVVMVGDQLLTDIFGAGTFGVRTILVKPLKNSDAFKTRINRFFEKRLLKLWYGKNYEQKWEENK